MNKKIIILLIIIFAFLGLVFFFTERTGKPEQPLWETVSSLQKEIQLIREEAWLGKISQEEAEEKLILLENKIAELIGWHNLQAEIAEFVDRRTNVEKVIEHVESRMMVIELQLTGIAEVDTELARPLWEELSYIGNAIYPGEISQEEAEEKLTALEDKITELITQHGIEAEAAKFTDRFETAKELIQQFEPRIRNIELQLGGIAEYLIQKYRTDTVKEVVQARALQNELMNLSDDIWEGEITDEEINKELLFFEDRAAELIAQYGIHADVDRYTAEAEAALERVTAISQRISSIRLQLHGMELYLSETGL